MNIVYVICVILLVIGMIAASEFYVSFLMNFIDEFKYYPKLKKVWNTTMIVGMSISYLALVAAGVGAFIGMLEGILGVSFL